MATSSILNDQRSARIAIVEQHLRFENQHDLEASSEPSVRVRGTMTSPGANTMRARRSPAVLRATDEGAARFGNRGSASPCRRGCNCPRSHDSRDASRCLARSARDRETSQVLTLRCYTFDSDNRLAGEKSITIADSVETTRRLPRAAKRVGANLHSSDSSGYTSARFARNLLRK